MCSHCMHHVQELIEREAKASERRVQSIHKAFSERDFNKNLNEQLIRNQVRELIVEISMLHFELLV